MCIARKSDEIRARFFRKMPQAYCAVLPYVLMKAVIAQESFVYCQDKGSRQKSAFDGKRRRRGGSETNPRLCRRNEAWHKSDRKDSRRSMEESYQSFFVTIPSCVALGEFRGALPSDLPPRKAANKIKSVFSGGVYLGKNTSRPASVRAFPRRECAQRGASPLRARCKIAQHNKSTS